MDKTLVEETVIKVVELIKTLPSGTETTTAILTGEVLGKEFVNNEPIELMEINQRVFEECEKINITLDNSEYNDSIVGLPYNIPFIVRH
ncbi:MAG: hypothetical protein Q4F12_02135 [Erysipelotrichaceae bacterium]|nr:hypothetical protein [Erysipelotrichaceae bacterium]